MTNMSHEDTLSRRKGKREAVEAKRSGEGHVREQLKDLSTFV